ncbi:phage structural protein [Lacrimispora sp.]|uniref:phage structural protein n=1 Tax=Lacrimispora sp. TaxID=2719234 RepID=UPI0028AE8677|nr:phage protein [Lacrimispora sp.]
MAEVVGTYNPKKVTMALGRHIASGFADDSFISIEFQGDGTTSVTGADGEIIRSIDPNSQAIVKLVLLQSSTTNKFLIEQHYKDKESGEGVFPVSIKDLLGKTSFSASVAWVPKLATRAYGKAANMVEWEIHTGASELSQK